jgi:hypothetical protein
LPTPFRKDLGSVLFVVASRSLALLAGSGLRVGLAPIAHVLAPAELLSGALVFPFALGLAQAGFAIALLVLPVALSLGLLGAKAAVLPIAAMAAIEAKDSATPYAAPPGGQRGSEQAHSPTETHESRQPTEAEVDQGRVGFA